MPIMTNAEAFRFDFGIYATELWSMPEEKFLEWLNSECSRCDKEPPDEVPAWIPVTERLPEHEYGESTSVLTVDLFGIMRVTYFDGGNWCWPSGEELTTLRVAPITHWMHLPEPPNGERKE